jgi:hypothetical protein
VLWRAADEIRVDFIEDAIASKRYFDEDGALREKQ